MLKYKIFNSFLGELWGREKSEKRRAWVHSGPERRRSPWEFSKEGNVFKEIPEARMSPYSHPALIHGFTESEA